MKNENLKVLYLPHTFVEERFLKPIAFFFDEVTVYQPSEWRYSPLDPELADCRSIRYETPAPAGGDLPALKRTVQEMLSWGDMAASSGQLNYLKHLDHAAVDENQDEILSALKGVDLKSEVDESAAARIFLHLAQEYDQRRDEIRRITESASASEEKLLSDLMLDGKGFDMPDSPVMSEDHEEGISVSARFKAWSTLFGGKTDENFIPLATDASLLELLPQHEILIDMKLPGFQKLALSEILEMRERASVSNALAGIKARLVATIKATTGTPWMPEGVDKHLNSLREVFAAFETEVSDLGTPNFHLALYAFPGVASSEIVQTKPTRGPKNGFAFLLTRRS